MKTIIKLIIILLCISGDLFAKVKVVVTYPYIADITSKIGKNKTSVKTLAYGNRDPHHIVARPSLISKMRRADLLIINGAQLEIGWLPPVLRGARNSKVQPGNSGFLDLSGSVKLIQAVKSVSRAQGDIHPDGNPHFILNPANVSAIAKIIRDRLCMIDSENRNFYRKNFIAFNKIWNEKMSEWKKALHSINRIKVIQYHRNFDYFLLYFGIESLGELEPLPGIPPTSRHILKTIKKIKDNNVRIILNDVYHSSGPAILVSNKTGIKIIVLPHDVGAVPEANDIVSLFDEIVRRFKK